MHKGLQSLSLIQNILKSQYPLLGENLSFVKKKYIRRDTYKNEAKYARQQEMFIFCEDI